MLSLLILIGVGAGTYAYAYHRHNIREYVDGYSYLCKMYGGSHVQTCTHLLQSVWTLLRAYLTQYVFHNSYLVKKGVYDIEYTIHLKTFRFRTGYKRGPCHYRAFFTSPSSKTEEEEKEEKDVSTEMLPYVGPNHDFHGIKYTPQDFGYSNLTLHYADGSTQTFHATDVLT